MLAIHLFRTVLVLVACFNFETKQYNAVNVFLNANLVKIVYIMNLLSYKLERTVKLLIKALFSLYKFLKL
jgi:hypothetical protein